MNATSRTLVARKPTASHAVAPRAFTLIELLVVIAIVALLVAILLPSLAEARRAGKQAKNVANMHAVAQAYATFPNDHKDLLATFVKNPVGKPVQATWSKVRGKIPQSDVEAAAYEFYDSLYVAGGIDDSIAPNAQFFPFLWRNHVSVFSYLGERVPMVVLVNPSDRYKLDLINRRQEIFAGNAPKPDGGLFLSRSSYEVTFSHWMPDACPSGPFYGLYEDSDGIQAGQWADPTSGQYIAGRYPLGGKHVADVLFPSDKVMAYEQVSRHMGKQELPRESGLAKIADVFYDSSVRVVRQMDVNMGGFGWRSGLGLNYYRAWELSYSASPSTGYPLWHDGSSRSYGGALGYQRWTVYGLKGRDTGGPQPKAWGE